MGDEYKPGPTKFTFDPVENWVARAEGIPAALEKAVTKKVAKRYGSWCGAGSSYQQCVTAGRSPS